MPTHVIDTGAQHDYGALAHRLARRFSQHSALDYLDGKTEIRDAAIDELGCSSSEAEDLVEGLISRGLLRYDGDPRHAEIERGAWVFVLEDV